MFLTKRKSMAALVLLLLLVGLGLGLVSQMLTDCEAGIERPEIRQTPVYPSVTNSEWFVQSEFDGVSTTPRLSNWLCNDWCFYDSVVRRDFLHSDGHYEVDFYDYRLDASRDPMWLDVIKDKSVLVGIVKIQGDKLTWLQGPWVSMDKWKAANGNVHGRPQRFEFSKADNLLLVLERSPYPFNAGDK